MGQLQLKLKLNKELYNQLQLYETYRKKYLSQKNLNKQLIEASKDGNLSQVKSLIIEGADIHAWEDCALNEAARNGQLEIVKYLVEDCDANVHAWDERTLRWAAWNGQLEIVKYLVSKGANVHARDNWALRRAAWKGHLDVVKYFATIGVNVHAQNGLALSMAAEGGHLEVVKYLKTYKLSQFTKKHIDKLNVRYVSEQYNLPFEIQQFISSYV